MSRKSHIKQAGAVHLPEWMGAPSAETTGGVAGLLAGGGIGAHLSRNYALNNMVANPRGFRGAVTAAAALSGGLLAHQLVANRGAIGRGWDSAGASIGRGVDSVKADLRESADKLKAGESPHLSAGLAALALSAGGIVAGQPGVARRLGGLGYGLLPAASAITAGAMAQQYGFKPKAALKRWSGATGDFGDAALGSGILGLGTLAATAGLKGSWRSKLLGGAIAAPLLVAGTVRGVSAASDAKKEYDIKAEKDWEELLAAVAKQPKHVDNPVNFAEFIKQNPGKAALGTLGVSALAYAAAGGNEGIARKIQAMKDNPGATAAGLGSLGVLSAATMAALKDNKKESA